MNKYFFNFKYGTFCSFYLRRPGAEKYKIIKSYVCVRAWSVRVREHCTHAKIKLPEKALSHSLSGTTPSVSYVRENALSQ